MARWYLVDPTWGPGEMNPKTRKWEKMYRDYYFLTPADKMIFSHFPQTPAHQQLPTPFTAQQFQFAAQTPVEFLIYGVSSKDILARLTTPGFRGFTTFNWDTKFPLRIVEAPVERHLKKGQTYRFRFEAKSCPKMFLAVNGMGQEIRRQGQLFEATVTPTQGRLQIGRPICRQGDRVVLVPGV